MRIGIVSTHATATNVSLADAVPEGSQSFVIAPDEAVRELALGDAALGRLDVRPTLDGIEDGLSQLQELQSRGVAMLNPPAALQLAHDKLATAGALAAASLPHPRTRTIFSVDAPAPVSFPLVVKPRFGSWGRDVMLCPDEPSYRRALDVLRTRPWFAATGAVAQELVPPLGHDLRVVIAANDVIGAVKRVAPAGEWRTNVALGATRVRTDPSPAACELAIAAAAAIGADLVGVDLLPVGPGRHVVLELNGAVDFTPVYASGGDVYAAAMRALVARLRSEPVLPLEPLEALGA
jgi:[lysine-biosynthesis-protein LysW]--L-2-aminoadipate ligase